MTYSFVKEEIGIQFVIFDAEYFTIGCYFIYDAGRATDPQEV